MMRPGLDEVLTRARSAWPDIDLPDDLFRAHLERHQAAEVENIGDLLLACACVHRHPKAVAIFIRQFSGNIRRAIAKIGLSAEARRDVEQTLLVRLLVATDEREPRIAEYSGRGPLAAWLRVAATRLSLNESQKERRTTALQAQENLADSVPAELEYLKERYVGSVKVAVERAFSQLDGKRRRLLFLHHVKGVTLERLASRYRVHRATVARWLAQARNQLLETTRALLAERFSLTTSEVDSLVLLVRSRIDLSIGDFAKYVSGL